MNMDRKILRIGTVLILGAVVLRLLGGGLASNILPALGTPRAASALLFLSTGRFVRYEESLDALPTEPEKPANTAPIQPETIPVTEPEPPQETLPTVPPLPQEPLVFSSADVDLIRLKDYCGYEISERDLLALPLSWDLAQEGPTVLILHTHGTESFENTEGYEPWGDYRTLDDHYNMISIGDRVAEILESAGIGVIHDRTRHDELAYTGSYDRARDPIKSYLKQYPSIQLILDLHRDSAKDSKGQQIGYTITTDRGESAQLMLVIGSNAGGLKHTYWRHNLALGVKIHAQLEKEYPGICRTLQLRTSRFNQDLSKGAVLIEVGSAGNTRQEALLAAELLAECLIQLSAGAVYE